MKSRFNQSLICVVHQDHTGLPNSSPEPFKRHREKGKYRSEIGIIFDMLTVVSNSGKGGVSASAIARSANISYKSTVKKCQRLISAGLVKSEKNDKSDAFFITQKGQEFFEQLRRFTETVESMNIRY